VPLGDEDETAPALAGPLGEPKGWAGAVLVPAAPTVFAPAEGAVSLKPPKMLDLGLGASAEEAAGEGAAAAGEGVAAALG
jgi:hypothetical protein